VKTFEEWEMELGRQIRSLRLRADLDQRQVAERAAVALNAVKNLESGRGATLRSLIQVLRVLNRTDWLGTLAPAVSISPIQMLKTKAPRQRASPRQKKPNQA
jgi:transcriptional regulator with XRE-family HTH domain